MFLIGISNKISQYVSSQQSLDLRFMFWGEDSLSEIRYVDCIIKVTDPIGIWRPNRPRTDFRDRLYQSHSVGRRETLVRAFSPEYLRFQATLMESDRDLNENSSRLERWLGEERSGEERFPGLMWIQPCFGSFGLISVTGGLIAHRRSFMRRSVPF